jgi:alpha-D-xyloside xylohydrolase
MPLKFASIEFDNYNYKKGSYSTITVQWDDAKKELTISDVKGSFPGMLETRTFQVVIVSLNHGTGVGVTDQIEKVVTYAGTEKKVVF